MIPLSFLSPHPIDKSIYGFSIIVSFNLGARNHQACMKITDGSSNVVATNRPAPTVTRATLNPGWANDSGGRGNNYANRRRSPSPSVNKPPVNHQTNLVPTRRPSLSTARHAGCQANNQSRIPVYQRNLLDAVQFHATL